MFFVDGKLGSGPYVFAGLGAFAGCVISFRTMILHLKNYRRPEVQRLAIRILWMVPVYAIASFSALSSRYLSDYIDTFRDIYEGFVIYSFFLLCINYLGGERALLAMLDERMRTHHLWPFNLFLAPMDMSDPDTFLFVRRGVLQFVVLKPVLSVFTMGLKLVGSYHEGAIAWNSPYLWISAFYNISVCWSLYCLVLFYVQCSKDLQPYRPMPKFVCVKSIVFLTFYQGLGVAFMVWAGWINDAEGSSSAQLALVLQDFLICIEMPFLALLHWYAFPWTDYNDQRLSSRVPLKFAVRDALGIKDIIQDAQHTFRGTTFRHAAAGPGQQRRLRASGVNLFDGEPLMGRIYRNGYGTLEPTSLSSPDSDDDDENSDGEGDARGGGPSRMPRSRIAFDAPEDDPILEAQYEHARRLPFGDYNYPVMAEDERFRYPPVVQEQIDRQAREYLARSKARLRGSELDLGNGGGSDAELFKKDIFADDEDDAELA